MKKNLVFMMAVLTVSAIGLLTGCADSKSADAVVVSKSISETTASKSSDSKETEETTVKISLDAPDADSFTFTFDGSYVYVDFDDVENATSYEWDFNDSIIEISKSAGRFIDVDLGENLDSRFRAVYNSGSETVYSDWTEVEYTAPKITYKENCPIVYGLYLTESDLEAVAKEKGYDVDKTTESDRVVVVISTKDSNNTGFLNGVARIVNGASAGFVGTVTDCSELIKSLNNLAGSFIDSGEFGESVKSAAYGLASDVNDGTCAAISGAFSANYITYTLTYTDVNAGADICLETRMVENNESWMKQWKGNFDDNDKLGRYIHKTSFGKCYMIVDTITEDGIEKYALTYTKE